MSSFSKRSVLSFFFLALCPLVTSAGTQFITGACTSDSDCAGSCCGFNSGKCAGPIIAQQRDGGCGFGNATPNDIAAVALGFKGAGGTGSTAAITLATIKMPAATGTAASSTIAAGTQFITGPCTSDADCAAGCCGFNSGLCAGPVIAQERDGGCGFGNASPNANAAAALAARYVREGAF